ncbi:MAG: low molecular weight phosphotyrosine protein phosphatase [Rhodospirillaceae bacterium]|nr:low molecular weight phosphotyrosine protein phosphatase [Rhodospirillaceae bacterium]MCA8933462.1 low molecular weight phosphotyrosine protein phosphatase [Rhodospirillaceae bacterium]
MTTRVLFVCSGNICRSPTAEAVMRKRAADAGLDVVADSAGFEAYHVGDPPDSRAQAEARRRGYDLSGQSARRLHPDDFEEFDLLLGMDRGHVAGIHRLAQRSGIDGAGKVHLFLNFTDDLHGLDVPDPYYGGAREFQTVLDLVERGVDALIAHLSAQPAQ